MTKKPRLPKPGGDHGVWADLLNEFLLVAHNPDGTPKKAEQASALAAGTVGLQDLNTTNLPGENIKNLILANDGTNLVWRKNVVVNVRDYGAAGDGATDDTNAIQSAINTVSAGGTVIFPRGTYMVRTLKITANGVQLSGTRSGVRLVRLSGTLPLVDMSGADTMTRHVRYGSLFSITLSGNSLPGVLLRSYYADTCVYRDVSFINCAGAALDFVEVWDTRFYDCSWEYCGSVDEPATLFRNSTLPGTFGYGADNTNQIHFLGCRWEAFRNGALRLEGAANGSTSLLNGVNLVSCKMESSLTAGPPFQIMQGTTLVQVNQLYIAITGLSASFTGPVDAILDYGTQVFMANVYVQWASGGIANSTVHIMRGNPHMYHEISAYYPTDPPAIATIVVEAAADGMIACLWANRGIMISGDATMMLESDPDLGLNLPIKNSGSFRIISQVTGKDLIKADNSSVRPTLHTVNGVDLAGFSGDFVGEKWRFYGDTGFVRLASGNFQIEGTKGYVGVGAAPYTNIAFLIKMANDTDRGLTIIRKSATATGRLVEFQDENNNIQGIAFDAYGRPLSVGRVANVAAGDQVAYANVRVQARDTAGSVAAAMKASPAPGSIAIITFFKPYPNVPLSITLTDHSPAPVDLYVSARSTTGFTVSTRKALPGGSQVSFDYLVMGSG